MADELPREVSRGTFKLGDIEIEVIHLDNGQRLISKESFERVVAGLLDCDPDAPEASGNA